MFSVGDIAKIREFGSSLVDSVASKAIGALPESMSSDKQFANGIAVSCALYTIADGDVEVDEVTGMLELIKGIKQVSDLDMTGLVITEFQTHIINLEELLKTNEALYILEVEKLLQEIAIVKKNEANRMMLINLANHIKAYCGKTHQKEIAMHNKIIEALGGN